MYLETGKENELLPVGVSHVSVDYFTNKETNN